MGRAHRGTEKRIRAPAIRHECGAKRVALVIATLVALAPACAFQNINVKEDTRLKIVTPEDRSLVQLPFTIRWEVRGFTITPPDGVRSQNAGYFALFFDRSPMPPGKGLTWLAEKDEACLRTPGCPDEEYLNRQYVYTMNNTSFEVTALPDTRPVERPQAKDRHEVTIVFLNGANERIGESAFSTRFIVNRVFGRSS